MGKLHPPPSRFTKMTLTPPLVLKLTLTSLKFFLNRQTPPFSINTVNFPLTFFLLEIFDKYLMEILELLGR